MYKVVVHFMEDFAIFDKLFSTLYEYEKRKNIYYESDYFSVFLFINAEDLQRPTL